ncbi:hypothetical protein V6N11_045148 [Hibiscus sabdariffa]|uniref:Uncharacterized protein n=2 Tax=Hibiscus sabdariffa TaxID=183260 RepID=A0ABR2BBM0_9ROSI
MEEQGTAKAGQTTGCLGEFVGTIWGTSQGFLRARLNYGEGLTDKHKGSRRGRLSADGLSARRLKQRVARALARTEVEQGRLSAATALSGGSDGVKG